MFKKIISVITVILCVCLVFSGCESVTTLLSGADAEIEYKIENGEATVKTVPNKSTVTEIVIPDEYEGVPVTKIADFSAANLEYVTKIHIGKNVKEIAPWSMTNNQHITAFEVDENNPYFCDVDGVIYTKDMKTLIFYPPAKDLMDTNNSDGKVIKVSKYTIPDGVEIIRSKAFYKCNCLTKIEIPASVKVIEERAFFRCEKVEEINLPDVLEFIGKDAFSYCYGLTEINIPASVKEIGEYAFYNCTNLKTVNVDNKENGLALGEKWYPTDNGLEIKDLKVNWN
ncbi:MAG: leucine-rich repeat domain-containing protein [Clostridia bacterium]|nr:leucine-rich repeat domain-containing protein [Clostridia bacterium]